MIWNLTIIKVHIMPIKKTILKLNLYLKYPIHQSNIQTWMFSLGRKRIAIYFLSFI